MKVSLTLYSCIAAAFLVVCPNCRADEEPLLVFAATSLGGSLDSLASQYMAKTGTPVLIAYGASGSLAQQIRIGADVDLFISADTGLVVRLADGANSAVSQWEPFLRNSLAIIASDDSNKKTRVFGPLDGSTVHKIAIADPESDPAGGYTRSYLQRIGIYDRVLGKLAVQDDVRGVINAVRLGVADLGFVFSSDVRTVDKVRLVENVADSLHPAIVFGLARIKGGRAKASAQFVDFLHSPAALKTFSHAGFLVDSVATRP